MSAGALRKFEIAGCALNDDASDAGSGRMFFEKADGGREELLVQEHVAIDQAEIPPPAVLKSELGPCPARAVLDVSETDDLDRISAGDLDRAVGGRTIGENDLSVHPSKRGERALDRRCDVLFFVECLDDNAHVGLKLLQHVSIPDLKNHNSR